MSTETKKTVKQDLIDILTDVIEKADELYQKMENLIEGKINTDIKQQIEAVRKYIADTELKLKGINTGLTLNIAEEAVLTVIKEKLKLLQTFLSLYSTMDTLNNITDKNSKQPGIEQALDFILDLLNIDELNIDDESENINDDNHQYADFFEIEKTDKGVIVHTAKGNCIIEGDIKNIKIVLKKEQ